MTEAVLPLWLEIIVAVLVLAGAALALLGSIGLLRLPTFFERVHACLLYTSPSPRDKRQSRMPSSA